MDAPYEPPLEPDVTVHTERESVADCVERIARALLQQGYLASL